MAEAITIEEALRILVANIKRELDRSDDAAKQAFSQQNQEIESLKRQVASLTEGTNAANRSILEMVQGLERRLNSLALTGSCSIQPILPPDVAKDVDDWELEQANKILREEALLIQDILPNMGLNSFHDL